MKKLLITVAAVMLATSAYATDLPNKKKAPVVPAPVAATEASSSTDSLTVAYGQDLGNNFGAKVDDLYQLTYSHDLGKGLSVGGMAQTTQAPSSLLNQSVEGQVGYALPAMNNITLSGKLGVGERFATTNFPYVAVYGNVDYKINDKVTLNAVQYTYTTAIDADKYDYKSNQLGTGITYNITKKYAVNASVTRTFDTSSKFNATGDQFMVGLTTNF